METLKVNETEMQKNVQDCVAWINDVGSLWSSTNDKEEVLNLAPPIF